MQALLVLHPASARILYHHVVDSAIFDAFSCTAVYNGENTAADPDHLQRHKKTEDSKRKKELLMIQLSTIANLFSVVIQQMQVIQVNTNVTSLAVPVSTTAISTDKVGAVKVHSQPTDYIKLEGIQCDQTHIWISFAQNSVVCTIALMSPVVGKETAGLFVTTIQTKFVELYIQSPEFESILQRNKTSRLFRSFRSSIYDIYQSFYNELFDQFIRNLSVSLISDQELQTIDIHWFYIRQKAALAADYSSSSILLPVSPNALPLPSKPRKSSPSTDEFASVHIHSPRSSLPLQRSWSWFPCFQRNSSLKNKQNSKASSFQVPSPSSIPSVEFQDDFISKDNHIIPDRIKDRVQIAIKLSDQGSVLNRILQAEFEQIVSQHTTSDDMPFSSRADSLSAKCELVTIGGMDDEASPILCIIRFRIWMVAFPLYSISTVNSEGGLTHLQHQLNIQLHKRRECYQSLLLLIHLWCYRTQSSLTPFVRKYLLY